MKKIIILFLMLINTIAMLSAVDFFTIDTLEGKDKGRTAEFTSKEDLQNNFMYVLQKEGYNEKEALEIIKLFKNKEETRSYSIRPDYEYSLLFYNASGNPSIHKIMFIYTRDNLKYKKVLELFE